MQASNVFNGLTMPVFSAFGWAGEENALKYALSQLQLFIEALYARLPNDMREEFPTFGLSAENQNVYLATGDTYDKEAYIAFNARPMSLEVQLGLVGQNLLSKGLAAVNKDPVAAHHVLTQLDPSWTLRVQQMAIDPEAGERAHHLDLFKDSVNNLTEEQAREIFERAAYLTEEDKWVTPVYLSLRLPSERVAAMSTAVLDINFWTFNVDRGGDLGSVWYVLGLAGVELQRVSLWVATLMVAGTLAICLLLLLSKRRARLGQGVFLIVALFLMLNKVYSPQYVLWLLPLLVLARPRWREWIVFSVAELLYFVAIWAHLDGVLYPGAGTQERLYWLAVGLRVAVQFWLCLVVVADIVNPRRDIVRADGADDSDGGVFDHAVDAPWLQRLRAALVRG